MQPRLSLAARLATLWFWFMLVVAPVQASVNLVYFRARSTASTIVLEWETANEISNLGFNLYRAVTNDWNAAHQAGPMNPSLIPSQASGQPTGAFYEWEDASVVLGVVYWYWLEDIDLYGGPTQHGPVSASTSGGNATSVPPTNTQVPQPTNTPQPSSSPTPTSVPASATPTAIPQTTATATRVGTAASTSAATASATGTASPLSSPSATRPPGGQATATPIGGITQSYPGPEGEELAGAPTAVLPADTTPTTSSPAAGITQTGGPGSSGAATAESGQLLAAQPIGGGSQPPGDAAGSPPDAAAGLTRRTTLAMMALLAGLVMTVGGGLTTWVLISRRRDH